MQLRLPKGDAHDEAEQKQILRKGRGVMAIISKVLLMCYCFQRSGFFLKMFDTNGLTCQSKIFYSWLIQALF